MFTTVVCISALFIMRWVHCPLWDECTVHYETSALSIMRRVHFELWDKCTSNYETSALRIMRQVHILLVSFNLAMPLKDVLPSTYSPHTKNPQHSSQPWSTLWTLPHCKVVNTEKEKTEEKAKVVAADVSSLKILWWAQLYFPKKEAHYCTMYIRKKNVMTKD